MNAYQPTSDPYLVHIRGSNVKAWVEREHKVGISRGIQCWSNPLDGTIPVPQEQNGPVEFLRCWTSSKAGATVPGFNVIPAIRTTIA